MASQHSLHSIAAFAAYSLHGIATSSALHRSIQCMASQHSVHSTAAFAAQHRSIPGMGSCVRATLVLVITL
jgi:hypothetical protein